MIEERKFHYSQFLFPALFVLVLWVIHLLKVNTNFDFVQFGLYPRRVENLFGIITSPFIHDDWEHLTNNSIPLLLLGFGIFYFLIKGNIFSDKFLLKIKINTMKNIKIILVNCEGFVTKKKHSVFLPNVNNLNPLP